MQKKAKKIIVAMSGGVDSSVVAAILKEQGHDLLGIFMHFWAEPGPVNDAIRNKCCSIESFNDARRVALKLGFPLYTINLDEPFKAQIVDSFLADYGNGLTPNPCVNCNRHIKFDYLLQKAAELGYDYIATGHYAKIIVQADQYQVWRPVDTNKDQTYFLHTLTQNKLKQIIFPLADLTKPEVRDLAKKFDLPVAKKPESQEICFITGKSHNDFLRRHLPLKSGNILTVDGQVVGEHQGLPLYTLGQRKGVEIGGVGPFYVVKLDYATNTVIVSNDGDDPLLYQSSLMAKNVSWIGGEKLTTILDCQAVIRYRHKPINCTITPQANDKAMVMFEQPQRAITPGQSVVFYNGEQLLGGGEIVA